MTTVKLHTCLFALVRLTRPVNVFLAAATVSLGDWLSDGMVAPARLAAMAIAAACATAFGNAVNDIADQRTDAVSHPERPLPKGDISAKSAAAAAIVLAAIAMVSGWWVSATHGIGAAAPLALLLIYARTLKATPLAGNLLVSVLVAYPLLYGALGTNGLSKLCVPAALAFLLNLQREIIKDVQDSPGDRTAGLNTSAVLPEPLLKALLAVSTLAYLGLLFVPWLRHDFGWVYAVVCLCLVMPCHLAYSALALLRPWRRHLGTISALIKLDMFLGLGALAADALLSPLVR